jgi:hypothetical protein
MIAAALAATGHGQARRGDTIRITIERVGMEAAPIVLTDLAITNRFRVGDGPGFFRLLPDGTRLTNTSPSLIVEWERRVSAPSSAFPVYKVSFVTEGHPGTYMLLYALNPATKEGYVYLPGKGDPEYEANTRMVFRGLEGNWFRAWRAWEEVTNPFIEHAFAGR